jgi:hypothetical protein
LGQDATNFYSPLTAGDLFTAGGLFVATYDKPPPLGSDLRVSVRFPNAAMCEFSGRVAWLRDHLGGEAGHEVVPGFGVRFVHLDAHARALIAAYAGEQALLSGG